MSALSNIDDILARKETNKLILLNELLETTIEENASDLHLTVGVKPNIRVNGNLIPIGSEKLVPSDTEKFAHEILGDKFEKYNKTGEMSTSYSVAGLGRFRVNVFKQRGSHALALRVVGIKVPTLDSLGLPCVLKELALKKRGIVLVTGPAGCGKSTTLAAMINEININVAEHIITLEEPIEFLHKHNKSIINQREIGSDSLSYKNALKAALREDPNVILIGEMSDTDNLLFAMSAAEAGHLVLSTLHTVGAKKTIDKIIDIFPPYQQQQVRVQLSGVLAGIVSQQLIPRTDQKGRAAALEIMVSTRAIQDMIREGKTSQIESSIQTGSKYGMKTMDMSLEELYKKDIISYESAMAYSIDKDMLQKMIQL